ncbi:MAG: class D sortase [Armatimonadota bacterium]
MQWLRLTKLPVFAEFLIVAGLICLFTPIIWSLQSNNLQSSERKSWDNDQKRGTQSLQYQRYRLIIPKLGLDAVVVEEITESDLNKGPMHMAGTPDPGHPGNCCIAAHKEKWFRGLAKLSNGDTVNLESGKTSYTYKVTGQDVVSPNDIQALADTRSPTLTLITCTGRPFFGSGSGRLLVRAKLASAKQLTKE